MLHFLNNIFFDPKNVYQTHNLNKTKYTLNNSLKQSTKLTKDKVLLIDIALNVSSL